MKRTRCPACKGKLLEGQRIHPDCIESFAEQQGAKAERAKAKAVKMAQKVERETDKARKEALKGIPDLLKEAQVAFNAFIRSRDVEKPCICCGKPLGVNDLGGSHDAGHYRSVGSASHLRFNEDNVHAQRKICNRWGAGRAVDYRIGLIARIGLERVEALESDNTPRKWRREELIEIKETYRRKLRELKSAQG
jgi:hypothetical protein